MVRIRRTLDSETLHIPELKPLIGKTVEITITEEGVSNITPGTGDWETAVQAAKELRESGYDFDAVREQRACDQTHANDHLPIPLDASTKEALRPLLTQEQYEALVEIAEQGGPDVEIIDRFRAASMT